MQHTRVLFTVESSDQSDMLIALLSEIGYDGFVEEDACMHAYIPSDKYDDTMVQEIANMVGISYSTSEIAARNWNAEWESSFEPVVVEGFCTVRAHFHSEVVTTPYCVVITPKMSFGTGHHATTQLMMIAMEDIIFAEKTVLDFGTGTGVLAILAKMLGAKCVDAIDNDEWAITNAVENVERNGVTDVELYQCSLEEVPRGKYDVVLANINRHILLQYMQDLYTHVALGGILLMSGLLVEDEAIVTQSSEEVGFTTKQVTVRNGWISIEVGK